MSDKILYFDNASTTSVHPEVISVITDTLKYIYGNPSRNHSIGHKANDIVVCARKNIAKHINCSPTEIIFTSGACEANTLAIKGVMDYYEDITLITTHIEHKSLSLLCENEKYNVKYVSVDNQGFVDIQELDNICRKEYVQGKSKLLVSIQSANSEIGTIQDIKAISSIVHKYNGIFHTDATQLLPYQKIDVREIGIDLLSMSGQKIHAPKGIGFLYVDKNVCLKPIIYGTQMEYRRGGTENVPYIAGLAKAIELLRYDSEISHIRDYIINKLKTSDIDCIINGSIGSHLPNNINVSFKYLEGESIMLLLDMNGICVSTGSACSSGDLQVSDVLKEISVPDDYVHGTIRITLTDDATYEDADYFIEKLSEIVRSLWRIRSDKL